MLANESTQHSNLHDTPITENRKAYLQMPITNITTKSTLFIHLIIKATSINYQIPKPNMKYKNYILELAI